MCLVDGNYTAGREALENWMTISKDELAALLERRNLAVPAFLRPCVKVSKGATPAPVKQGNKLRRNNLDPAIDKAIKQAGNMALADVYLKLKALAIDEEKPFTGALDGDALCYTNDDNKPAKLTKDALGKRLKNRR